VLKAFLKIDINVDMMSGWGDALRADVAILHDASPH
jgi:hypothetical protein